MQMPLLPLACCEQHLHLVVMARSGSPVQNRISLGHGALGPHGSTHPIPAASARHTLDREVSISPVSGGEAPQTHASVRQGREVPWPHSSPEATGSPHARRDAVSSVGISHEARAADGQPRPAALTAACRPPPVLRAVFWRVGARHREGKARRGCGGGSPRCSQGTPAPCAAGAPSGLASAPAHRKERCIVAQQIGLGPKGPVEAF